MATTYQEYPALKTVEIVIDGKVTEAEFDQISDQMENFIQEHETVKIIEIIKDFEGFDLVVLGKGIKFDLKYLKNFSHCAVVADNGWIGPFARMMSPFFNIEIKTFKLDEEEQAREWLNKSV